MRQRGHRGAGCVYPLGGGWAAQISRHGRKIRRHFRTEELARAGLGILIEQYRADLGWDYQGWPKPFPFAEPSRRGGLSPRLRFTILERDGFRCRYCGAPAPDVRLSVDHILPVAAGGTDDPLNLAAACQDCNLGKSDRVLVR